MFERAQRPGKGTLTQGLDHAHDSDARVPGKQTRVEQELGASAPSMTSGAAEPAAARGAPEVSEPRPSLIERVFRRASGAPTSDPDAAVASTAGSTGAPLPAETRSRFESNLGSDLSSVRVHTGAASAAAAEGLGARAFAIGQDIHFGAGHYQPDSPAGNHLLAHEVAHTVQQRSGSAGPQTKLEVSQPGDAFEVEADRAADAMVSGAPATISGASGPRLARDPVGDKKDAPAPTAGNDIVDAGEAAVNAGSLHVSPMPADREWTKSELRFDDPAVERLLIHLITTWLHAPDPKPLTEVPAEAQAPVPGWVPQFRVRALSTMKADSDDQKRLSKLANQLADAVSAKTSAEKFREDVVAKATPGQAIMSQAAIDKKNESTTAGKFTTCIVFAGQMVDSVPRPKGAVKVPPFSGPNDYKEVNPAAKQYARDVFPEGTWHQGTEGMTDRPKPGDLLILGFAKATPYGEGAKRVVLSRGAFAHIDILRAIRSAEDATQGETWITTDGGGTASTQGTRTYHPEINILTDKNGDRLLIGWFDIVRMAGL